MRKRATGERRRRTQAAPCHDPADPGGTVYPATGSTRGRANSRGGAGSSLGGGSSLGETRVKEDQGWQFEDRHRPDSRWHVTRSTADGPSEPGLNLKVTPRCQDESFPTRTQRATPTRCLCRPRAHSSRKNGFGTTRNVPTQSRLVGSCKAEITPRRQIRPTTIRSARPGSSSGANESTSSPNRDSSPESIASVGSGCSPIVPGNDASQPRQRSTGWNSARRSDEM